MLLGAPAQVAIAQLAARRSHNPRVVSLILTCHIWPMFHAWIRTSANPLHQSRLKVLGPEGHSSQNPARLIHGDPKIVLPQGVQAVSTASAVLHRAAIAQLGEHQTEDLKVPGSIPGLGMVFSWCDSQHMLSSCVLSFAAAATLHGSLASRAWWQ